MARSRPHYQQKLQIAVTHPRIIELHSADHPVSDGQQILRITARSWGDHLTV